MKSKTRAGGIALLSTLLYLGACAETSPEERVAELRSQYEAELTSFTLRETPTVVDVEVVTPDGDAEDEAADASAASAASDQATPAPAEVEGPEGAEGAELPPEEVPEPRKDVMLDIVVWHQAAERLPGLTLDVVHADEAENAKETHRLWIDTSGVPRGARHSFTEVIEDVEFEPGDRFFVEVRDEIPPQERSEYREFS